jgi:hypothetical protein
LINPKSEGGRESHGERRYIILGSLGRREGPIITVGILGRTWALITYRK